MANKVDMKNVILIASVLVLIGCNEGEVSKTFCNRIKILNDFKLSPVADSLLREYVKSVPAAPAYAIFIDKKSGTLDYMITIAPFKKPINSMYESGAANYFMLTDTVAVFLYTGLEDFIVSDSSAFTDAKKRPDEATGEFKDYDPISEKVDFESSWSYVHLDTISYVVKGNDFPFISNTVIKPTIQFNAPDSKTVK